MSWKMQCRWIFIIVLTISQLSSGQNSYVYYHYKESVPIQLHPHDVAVLKSPNISLDEFQMNMHDCGMTTSTITCPIDSWHIMGNQQLQNTNTIQLQNSVTSLSLQPTVDFISPIFKMANNEMLIVSPWIIVGFNDNVDKHQAYEIINDYIAGQIIYEKWNNMSGVYYLKTQSKSGYDVLSLANQLALLPEIKFSQPDMLFTGRSSFIPNDTEFSNSWGLHNTGQDGGIVDIDMDGPEAWDITTGDPNIIVVILDTGVQQDHPDINQIPGNDFTDDLSNDGGPVNQYDNHGTPVAGCVSATINNALGTTGIAPVCKIASARAFRTTDESGAWWSYASWTVDALNWAQTIGAKVTNNSNYYGFTSSAIANKYQELRDNGIIHFASAGNNSDTDIDYPASLPSVNAIGAINNRGIKADFSNYGSGIDYVAPGEDIYTTDRTGADGWNPEGDYVLSSGTSFASPYAAGVAALIFSKNKQVPVEQVENILKKSCIDLGTIGKNSFYGWGLVNAHDALLLTPSLGEQADPNYGGGDGTENNPFQIWTSSQMNWIGIFEDDWDKHFILMADIDMSGITGTNYNIIGNDEDGYEPFKGVFDGNFHSISNFTYYYDESHIANYGLFGVVSDNDVMIKNVTLIEPNIIIGTGPTSNVDEVGAIVGHLIRGSLDNCHVNNGYIEGGEATGGLVGLAEDNTTIKNCSASLKVKGQNVVGGIVGWTFGDVIDCWSSSEVVFTQSLAGGLIGSSSGSSKEVKNCYAIGSVYPAANASFPGQVGGLIGKNRSHVINCYSKCNVTGNNVVGGLIGWNFNQSIIDCYAESTVVGTQNVGGLIGRSDSAIIRNCYSDSIVSGDNSTGGFIGGSSSSLQNCYAKGVVTGTDYRFAGFIGFNDGEIRNCYSHVDVFSTGNSAIAGFIGYNGGDIINCYSSGQISGSGFPSGFVDIQSQGTTVNSFWDKETSGKIFSDSGVGKTTQEMQELSTYLNAGWDFIGEMSNGTEDIWYLCEGNYPKLSWQRLPMELSCPDGIGLDDLIVLSENWLSETLNYDFYPQFGDGVINMFDFSILSQQQPSELANYVSEWLKHGASIHDIGPEGGDGKFNLIDFSVLSSNWLLN